MEMRAIVAALALAASSAYAADPPTIIPNHGAHHDAAPTQPTPSASSDSRLWRVPVALAAICITYQLTRDTKVDVKTDDAARPTIQLTWGF